MSKEKATEGGTLGKIVKKSFTHRGKKPLTPPPGPKNKATASDVSSSNNSDKK